MTRLVDLDNLVGLERAWGELEHVHAIRALDPELRTDILRHLDRLDVAAAAPVRAALDSMHPEMVLETYFDVIVPRGSLPTINAARSPRRPPLPPSLGSFDSYIKDLSDMVGAGWPREVANDAVVAIAIEDGMEPDLTDEIRRSSAI